MNKISTSISIILVMIVAVLLNSISSNMHTKIDITQNKLYTLSDGTKKVLDKLKDDINLKLFMSNLTGNNKANYNDLESHKKNVLEFLEQYSEYSKKIKFDVVLVDPDSEEEDTAVRYGLQGAPIPDGTKFFIGLVAINGSVKEAIIPLINPDPTYMASFEYEATKIIVEASLVKKPIIGVMSSFPVVGTKIPPEMAAYNQKMKDQKPWAFIKELEYYYEFHEIPKEIPDLNGAQIDGLIIIHPKGFPPSTQFAIDQYILNGGKVILFTDELSVFDNPPDESAAYGYKRTSELDILTSSWGLKRIKDTVLGDKLMATEMTNQNSAGNYETVMQPTILTAGPNNFQINSRITFGMQNIFIPYAGVYEKTDKPGLKVESLVFSSKNNIEVPTMIVMSGDPNKISSTCTKLFAEKGERDQKGLVYQITGKFTTAFPDGKPKVEADPKNPTPPDTKIPFKESHGNPNVILVTDADILQDKVMFRQNQLGQMANSNFAFVQNLIELTMGNEDLITIRTKAIANRPFVVLEDIKKKAEENTQKEIEGFQKKEADASEKLSNLKIKSENGVLKIMLTPEQIEEQKKLTDQMAETRKQIRKLQYQQRKDVESMVSKCKFFNYAFFPLLISLIGLFVMYFQNRRVKKHG